MMKYFFSVCKIIFWVIILVTFHSQTFSQRFDAGVIAGAIASQVSGDRLAGYNKPGFEFGGLVSTSLSEKFDLSFQITFIQKGSRKNINAEAGDFSYYRMRLNYVQVPVLIQYNFSKKLRFEAGTGIAVLLSSSEEDESGSLEFAARKEFSKFEWTMMASMNYMLWENFFLILGIENSMLPIRNFQLGEVRLDRDQYNSLLRFSIRYIFKPQKSG